MTNLAYEGLEQDEQYSQPTVNRATNTRSRTLMTFALLKGFIGNLLSIVDECCETVAAKLGARPAVAVSGSVMYQIPTQYQLHECR